MMIKNKNIPRFPGGGKAASFALDTFDSLRYHGLNSRKKPEKKYKIILSKNK